MEDVKMKVRVRITGPLSFCIPGNLTLYMQIIILSKLTHNFGTALIIALLQPQQNVNAMFGLYLGILFTV